MWYLRKVHFENSKQRTVQNQVLFSRSSWVSKLGVHISASSWRINIQIFLWKYRILERWGHSDIYRELLWISSAPQHLFISLCCSHGKHSSGSQHRIIYKFLRSLIFCSGEFTTPTVCSPHGSKAFLCQWQTSMLLINTISLKQTKKTQTKTSHLALNKKEGFSTRDICFSTLETAFS